MTRIVVMGVAASGKTTIGRRLARDLGLEFLDADDAHPPENIAKMSAGIPLTDDDRGPWLDRLRQVLSQSDSIVVTCSALKRDYRDVLRAAGTDDDPVWFVFLDVPRDEIVRRIERRRDHFMKADMVDSQFAALEPPGAGEDDVAIIDVSDGLEATHRAVRDAVAR